MFSGIPSTSSYLWALTHTLSKFYQWALTHTLSKFYFSPAGHSRVNVIVYSRAVIGSSKPNILVFHHFHFLFVRESVCVSEAFLGLFQYRQSTSHQNPVDFNNNPNPKKLPVMSQVAADVSAMPSQKGLPSTATSTAVRHAFANNPNPQKLHASPRAESKQKPNVTSSQSEAQRIRECLVIAYRRPS